MVSFAAVVRDALRDIPKDGCERGTGPMVGSVGRWSVFSGHLDSIEAFELLIVLNPSFRRRSTASSGNEKKILS